MLVKGTRRKEARGLGSSEQGAQGAISVCGDSIRLVVGIAANDSSHGMGDGDGNWRLTLRCSWW